MREFQKFEGAGVGEGRGGEPQLARGHMLSLAKCGFVVGFASSMVVVGRVRFTATDATTPTVGRASGHIHVLASHTRVANTKLYRFNHTMIHNFGILTTVLQGPVDSGCEQTRLVYHNYLSYIAFIAFRYHYNFFT